VAKPQRADKAYELIDVGDAAATLRRHHSTPLWDLPSIPADK